MIRARRGIGHSPAEPAHRMRSPRTSVTAFGTTPRPVPSHKLAWIIAIDGSGAGASWSLGALRAQALRTSVEMSIEEPTAGTRFIPALLALVATRHEEPWGVSLTWTCFKLLEKSAFSRD